MKKVLLLSCSIFFAACTGHTDDKEDADAATLAAVTQTPVAGQVAEAVMTNDVDISLIQGNWVSVDDAKSKLTITKDKYILAYDGESVADSADYTLNKKDCSGNSTGDDSYYISLPKDNMCYIIDFVDKENLSLIYTARGNTLTYKRMK